MRGCAMKPEFEYFNAMSAGKAARAVLCATLLFASVPHASAADDATWLRDQLRQTTVELRRLQEENGALQIRLEKAARESAAPVAADTQTKIEARRARADAERIQAENVRLQTELVAANERANALQQSLAAVQGQLQAAEQARVELTQAAGTAAQCERDNAELSRISLDVIARYRERGFWDALRESEPLTGITRARHEALTEKYRAAVIDVTRAGIALPAPAEQRQ